MNTADVTRRSAIDTWLRAAGRGSSVRESLWMPDALNADVPAGSAVVLSPLCWRRRCGLKGPSAEAWLAARGFNAAPGANSWAVTDGVLVGRLATSEFLVEALSPAAQAPVATATLALAAPERPAGVYPVARQDLVIRLRGPRLNDLLRQTCSVDFAPLLAAPGSATGPLVMTSMVGVGVVAVPSAGAMGSELCLWADPSFGTYFWTTLLEVAADMGGGVQLDTNQ